MLAQEREHPDAPGSDQSGTGGEREGGREREERVAVRPLLPMAPGEEGAARRRTKSKAQREKVTKARTSTTDPQARVMKMPDGPGSVRPTNVELATDRG